MAKIVFASTLTAADQPAQSATYDVYEPAVTVDRLKRLDPDNNKVATLPDRRAYRSMNRSAVILAGAALKAKEYIDGRGMERFRIGFYCATDNGPDNFACAKEAPENTATEFSEYYRKKRSPKDYLKQLPNLVPAQVAIFMELTGLLNVYNNSRWGGLQAVEQAEFDLQNGIVDLAVVGATNSVEDPLRAKRRVSAMEQNLVEGAAILVMEKGEEQNWAANLESLPTSEDSYGIADPVVRFANAYEK